MVWYPGKAAFRVGAVVGTQWDDVNIGDNSVAMGGYTVASGGYSTAIGNSTTASGLGDTAIGVSNTASGGGSTALGTLTTASGVFSTALGIWTIASGVGSTAIGSFASTNGMEGSFVYGDYSTQSNVEAAANNQFVVRASGGFRFRTAADLGTGCDLPAGSGVFACTSSRQAKDSVRAVDVDTVLARLRAVPVTSWSYMGETGVRHMGPFAEDFHAAFALGVDNTSIGLLDIDGVNLAAIQALDARTQRLQEENAAIKAELAALRQAMVALTRQQR